MVAADGQRWGSHWRNFAGLKQTIRGRLVGDFVVSQSGQTPPVVFWAPTTQTFGATPRVWAPDQPRPR